VDPRKRSGNEEDASGSREHEGIGRNASGPEESARKTRGELGDPIIGPDLPERFLLASGKVDNKDTKWISLLPT
jgi:hypothetical protein